MALSTVNANNKLVQYRKELIGESFRENLFSPYMGDDPTSIIRRIYDPKKGGEQVNIPTVGKLTGAGKSTGRLTDNEEKIDNYGMRAYVDWARHAVATNKAEEQKDSADIFGEAKPLLSEWVKRLQRDEIIASLLSLPTESAPVGMGGDEGNRITGILYEDATATQRNTWNADNSDRVVYGKLLSNYNATHATALANIDTTDDVFTAASSDLMKYVAMQANPGITPYMLKSEGREYFVAFHGSNTFRQLRASLQTINKDARPREGNGMDKNPIFQAGNEIYGGVIHVEVPEIDLFVTNVWTSLLTAGNGSSRVAPVFLCGQQAVAMPWAQLPKPTFREEKDYGFIEGVGTEMCYGIAKIFKKTPSTGTKLVQLGMVTGFFSASNPS